MNVDTIMIIFGIVAALILFVPTLMLLLLPCVKRASGGKKAAFWIFGSFCYLCVGGLMMAWAGDIIQNRSGDLSIVAFYAFMVLYIVSPFFYIVFFRNNKSSVVFPIIIASLMGASGIALGLVPILYGVTTQFGIATLILGCAGIFMPQLLNALFYALLAKRANTFRLSDEGKDY